MVTDINKIKTEYKDDISPLLTVEGHATERQGWEPNPAQEYNLPPNTIRKIIYP